MKAEKRDSEGEKRTEEETDNEKNNNQHSVKKKKRTRNIRNIVAIEEEVKAEKGDSEGEKRTQEDFEVRDKREDSSTTDQTGNEVTEDERTNEKPRLVQIFRKKITPSCMDRAPSPAPTSPS